MEELIYGTRPESLHNSIQKINVASKDQSVSTNAESSDGICVVFMVIQCENDNRF